MSNPSIKMTKETLLGAIEIACEASHHATCEGNYGGPELTALEIYDELLEDELIELEF